MSTKSNTNISNKILIVGLAGATAVSVQTISLVWINNILKKQKQYGLNLFECALKIYEKGGLKSLFKGSFPVFAYTTFARFGDTASNFYILNIFKNNPQFQQTPLFIQTIFSWCLSSLWRISLTPISTISHPISLASTLRSFHKQILPQIRSLYSWFLIQNYLTHYTTQIKYQQNGLKAFIRYGTIGFLSMITYDTYLRGFNFIKGKYNANPFWGNKVFVKGMHGWIFCTSSHFIKEKLESQDKLY